MDVDQFNAKLVDLARRAARDLPLNVIEAELQAVIDQLRDGQLDEQPAEDS